MTQQEEPAVPEHPFDKVLMTAQIAGLQMRLSAMTEQAIARDKAISDLTGRLRDQGKLYTRAVSVGEAKLAETFSQLTAWLSPEDQQRWLEQLANKDFIHGLKTLVTSLILEVVNGNGSCKEAGAD